MKTAVLACVFGCVTAAMGQTIPSPYSVPYSFFSLGQPQSVPTNFGGLCFKPGDANTLLIGGGANGGSGAIYAVPLTRDVDNRITGFAGPGVLYAPAANIDGGLTVAPNGNLVYTTYSNNQFGQVAPNGTAFPRIDLAPLGIASSTGTCQFIPPGFPGAGGLVIASYNIGTFYRVPFTAPTGGAMTLSMRTATASTSGGPEGIVYVPVGSPLIPFPSMLVCEYGVGTIAGYSVDADGLPITASRFVFMTGLTGAEGATLDPRTNDFLFSTYGGSAGVVVVRGFVPPPCNEADIGAQGGVPIQDGRLNNNDFVVFVNYFFASDPKADLGIVGGTPGHDGVFDNNDFVAFINYFFSPCHS